MTSPLPKHFVSPGNHAKIPGSPLWRIAETSPCASVIVPRHATSTTATADGPLDPIVLSRPQSCLQKTFPARCTPHPGEDQKTAPNTQHSTIDIPLPTLRLATVALRAIRVDAELSPLVQRDFSLIRPDGKPPKHDDADSNSLTTDENATILRTQYRATTNRMLRVAVNGFMESLGVVLQIMEELDIDVVAAKMKQ
jgi:EKC/KEOPS complex subunit PCC1/LAGE3